MFSNTNVGLKLNLPICRTRMNDCVNIDMFNFVVQLQIFDWFKTDI
jgi:hypothetical protein